MKQVQSVALRAWTFTYRKIYSTKSIERYVSSYYSDQRFKERVLPRVRKGFDWFFVALDEKRVVGYSHIGRGRIGWELLRIYLLPQYIGKGVGKKLLQLGETFLKCKKARTYFVTSHKRNRLGIEFYLRNGFTITSKMVDGRASLCFEKRLL